MRSIEKMSKKEKIAFLNSLFDSEDIYFNDYKEELKMLLSDPESDIREKAISAAWYEPSMELLDILIKM